jgi:hypothetical protein
MKFVSVAQAVHALQCFAVSENGYWRPAKIVGGRSSLSGLTIESPWVEQGAVLAFREDFLPSSAEALERLLDERFAYHPPERIVMFSGHGTDPHNFRQVSVEGLKAELEAWRVWRTWQTHSGLPPMTHSEEGYLAKRATRDRGDMLTAGEALRGLQARAGGSICQLEVTLDPATEHYPEPEWDWEVLAPGVGRARGSALQEGVEPDAFFFEPAPGRDAWQYEDLEGKAWDVFRDLNIFSEGGGLKAEYRWHRQRHLGEGCWETEYLVTDDKEQEGDWTQERPW